MNTATHQELPSILAVPGMDHETTGAIVYWSLRGGSANHADVCKALTDAGMDPTTLPPLPTPKVAFWRAVQSMETKTRFMRKGSGVSQFFLIDEDQNKENIALTKNIHLHLAPGGVVVGDGEDPAGLIPQVAERYQEALGEITHRDVSVWLTKQVEGQDCVSMRPGGGMYFVPKGQLEEWRKVTRAMKDATPFKFFEIPAMQTEDAMEAILDAITREAESEIGQIREDLTSDKLGGRALRTRANRCERMCEKVERYEALLGTALPTIREQLTDLEASSATAALKADMEASKDA